jgi:predicted dehydrogenase
MLNDPEINTIVISTRHNTHYRMTVEALEAGKHVFVEKPLCLRPEELSEVEAAYRKNQNLQLMVGFNRRFSPHAIKMKSLLQSRTEPLTMCMMVNAGVIPANSWTQDPAVGGGRIIGEGCHWIDLMMFLAGSPVTAVSATRIGERPGVEIRDDKMSITLNFADGSIGTLHYFGNGHKSYPKERLEVFGDGKILLLDNFRVLRAYGWAGFSKMKLSRMDKGHAEEFKRFTGAVAAGDQSVIPFDEIRNVMDATFAAVQSAQEGQAMPVRQECQERHEPARSEQVVHESP